jgi:hypothetical protein
MKKCEGIKENVSMIYMYIMDKVIDWILSKLNSD